CPLLALSGHFVHPAVCPLLGVKRTLALFTRTSATGSKDDLAASLPALAYATLQPNQTLANERRILT
ncbi:MAG: hypothetical protein V3V97_20645, partial [Hyphomicrobiaceae bacterium]